MPAQASLVLTDGAASRTFVPNGALAQPNGKIIAEWIDRSSAYKVGFATVMQQFSPANGNHIEKNRWVIVEPTLETLSNNTSTGVNPAPTKAYDTTVIIEVHSHDRALASEMSRIVNLGYSLMGVAGFQTSVINRERPW